MSSLPVSLQPSLVDGVHQGSETAALIDILSICPRSALRESYGPQHGVNKQTDPILVASRCYLLIEEPSTGEADWATVTSLIPIGELAGQEASALRACEKVK